MSRLTHVRSEISIHQKLQRHLQSLFGSKIELEARFPSIQKRADCFLKEDALVFEIQVSKISLTEILKRQNAYLALGISVIWLIEKRFDRLFTSSNFEKAKVPYYYFSDSPTGFIFYDRLFLSPYFKLRPKRFDLKSYLSIKPLILQEKLPFSLKKRFTYNYFFKGDYLDGSLSSPPLLAYIQAKEATFSKTLKKRAIFWIKSSYASFFKKLLRNACS